MDYFPNKGIGVYNTTDKEIFLNGTAPAAPGELSILQEAEKIINGPRRDSYGDAKESFHRIADVWSAVLRTKVTPHQALFA